MSSLAWIVQIHTGGGWENSPLCLPPEGDTRTIVDYNDAGEFTSEDEARQAALGAGYEKGKFLVILRPRSK